MPQYTFKNERSGIDKTYTMSYEEMLQFKEYNPHLQQVFVMPLSASPEKLMTRQKPDEHWRDHLRSIKKHHRGSVINTFD